jgi:hypothetical protein
VSDEGSAKILLFRRPKPAPIPFLVHVQSLKESFCHPCDSLEKALDYIDQQEADESVVCSLYQNLPLEEDVSESSEDR